MSAPSLHFRRVQLRRMPGIDGAFTVDRLSPGINVVFGPNGCGKSRTARAINTLLWPDGRDRASLAGVASLDADEWHIDLDAGAVNYQRGGADSSPPHLPPIDARDRYNLPLHDLLHDDSAAFAETILKESAGGYDLKRLAQAVAARPAASGQGRELAAVKQSAAKLKEAEDAQRRLLDDEQRLADLEEQLAHAEKAAGRAESLRKALLRLDAADALDAAKAALERFEPGVARVRGDEPASLERLQKAVRDAQAALEKSKDDLARWEDALRKCAVGEQGVPDLALKALASRCQRLADLRAALDAAGRDRDAALAERAKARSRIAPAVSDEQLARVDLAGLADVEAFARDLAQAKAQAQAQDALCEWVGKAAPPQNLDQSTYALQLLWRWLQTPAPATAAPAAAPPSPVLLAVAGAFIAVQALVLAATVHWAFAALIGVPLVLLILARRPAAIPVPPAPDARALTQEEFAKRNLPGPAQWTADDVAAAADRLAREVAAARVEEDKAKRWDNLAARREAAAAALKRLDVRRKFVAAHLGVPPETDELSLVALASNVARWQDADARAAGAAAKYDAVLEQHADEVAAAAALLREHGVEPRDGAEVAAALDSLRERQKQFEVASAERAAAAARNAAAERQLADARAQVAALFDSVGLEPGDEAALRRWCAQRPARAQAQQAEERAAVALQLADAALRDNPSLREAPRQIIEQELRGADEDAARVRSLRTDAVEIRTRIADAKKAANVEEALSRHGENLAALAAKRDDDCNAVASWVLTEYLRRENRDRHRPAVFHRARELFSRVTQGRYRLDFDDATDQPEFRAIDTSTGAGHGLDELSSGTRLQLLLAVRVAFVEEQERGVKLPLLLDETLANSDETRARAIIDATIAIARSGRQVFYFTAQLDEVAKWKAILEQLGDVPHRLIDLAEARGLAATERLPLREITALPQPKVPEPTGLSREAYAALLQVPAFDPSKREVGGTHLWHLVEDPRVLHKFLSLGVNTWGQLRTLGRFNSDVLVNGSADAYRRAAAAAKALEALGDAWRVGRGRRVDRQVILDSGAVTANFIDRVAALAESLGGDAARLVAALEAGQVPRFRTDATTGLRAYLVENGYIDERPPLSVEQVRARLLAAVADDIRDGCFDPGRVDEYLAACTAGN